MNTDNSPRQLRQEVPVLEKSKTSEQQAGPQVRYDRAGDVTCHSCGTLNEASSQYCMSCGAPLHGVKCPNCGSEMDADSDFCEVCHRYIRHDVCSFCGARIGDSEGYCPECGSPRGGIICPTCHTLNDFSFCKQCGGLCFPVDGR